MECVNGLVVCFWGDTRGGEGEVGTGRRGVFVCFGSQRQDHTVSTATAAGQSPVEVSVVFTVGN